MMLLVIATMLAAAPADTSAAVPRRAFSDCLKEAVTQAKTRNLTAHAFDGFARNHCAATEDTLKKAVMAIDLKNGVSRKQALENAEMDVNDYFISTEENYEYELSRSAPKQEEPAAPEPQPQQQPQPQPQQPQPQPQQD